MRQNRMIGLKWIVLVGLILACGVAWAQGPNEVPQSGFVKRTEGASDVRAMLYKLCAAMGTVLILGGVAMYVLRVVMPKFGPVKQKRVKIVEVHHLGGRKMLHLVEVGHRQLLVGSTPNQVSMLADVTQHWDGSEDLMAFAESGEQS